MASLLLIWLSTSCLVIKVFGLQSQWLWIDNCFSFGHESLQRFFINIFGHVFTTMRLVYLWQNKFGTPIYHLCGLLLVVSLPFDPICTAALKKPLDLCLVHLTECINSCSAPTKFDPFLERICLTFRLLAISLLRAWMKQSVVVLWNFYVYCPASKKSKHCTIRFYFTSFEFYLEWSKHVNCTICGGCCFSEPVFG